MKRKHVEAFSGKFEIDLSTMAQARQATWYRAVAKLRQKGHTEEMPIPPFTLEEIELAERIIAAMPMVQACAAS